MASIDWGIIFPTAYMGAIMDTGKLQKSMNEYYDQRSHEYDEI